MHPRNSRIARTYPELIAVLVAAAIGLSVHAPLAWLAGHQGINVLLAVLVFATARSVEPAALRRLNGRWRPLLACTVAGITVLPALSWAASRLLPQGMLRHGVMAVGLAPARSPRSPPPPWPAATRRSQWGRSSPRRSPPLPSPDPSSSSKPATPVTPATPATPASTPATSLPAWPSWSPSPRCRPGPANPDNARTTHQSSHHHHGRAHRRCPRRPHRRRGPPLQSLRRRPHRPDRVPRGLSSHRMAPRSPQPTTRRRRRAAHHFHARFRHRHLPRGNPHTIVTYDDCLADAAHLNGASTVAPGLTAAQRHLDDPPEPPVRVVVAGLGLAASGLASSTAWCASRASPGPAGVPFPGSVRAAWLTTPTRSSTSMA